MSHEAGTGHLSDSAKIAEREAGTRYLQNAAPNMGAECRCTIIVEDAVSGVRAGAKSKFTLVIGVARENNGQELRGNGADVVVEHLSQLDVETSDELVGEKQKRV